MTTRQEQLDEAAAVTDFPDAYGIGFLRITPWPEDHGLGFTLSIHFDEDDEGHDVDLDGEQAGALMAAIYASIDRAVAAQREGRS